MTFDDAVPILDAHFATQYSNAVDLTNAYVAMMQIAHAIEVPGRDFRSEVIRITQLPYYKERLTLNYQKRLELFK